uniref:Protein TIC 214 n=1 Tax=Platycerium bifurcatum TaxID=187371 RepID=A0A7U3Q0A2_9MONI|nr:Ycf1 [Platycerium bifurcatum]QPG86033.1 Ycf1 [Platycerium bifurcatum]
MNINILNSLSLTGLKLMSPYILFGIYYGFLATLPVGPSQILCLRAFLLGGNLSGLVSLSGSMVAQLAITSTIYCSPIYVFLLKPHIVTIVVIPYMVLFCLTINDLPDYQILRPVTSLRDLRLISLFLTSFMFQILNPVLLPNPVLSRLAYLFFFRYSNNLLFVLTSFSGWLTGHMIFNYLSKLLLIRVRKDSPLLYLLVKRTIYTTFSIVFVFNALIYLGRAPVPSWTIKFINEPHDKEISFWDIAEYSDFLWWFFKPWPTSFFDPSRENRSNRFIRNSRSDLNSSFYKGKTSTYFFKKCITDGKQRLCIAALPSSLIFEKELEKATARSYKPLGTRSSYRKWILQNLMKGKIFQEELLDRVKLLDIGFPFSEAMETKNRLLGASKKRVPYVYDPIINNLRMRIPIPQTFLTGDEFDLARWNWNDLETRKKIKRRKRSAINRNNCIKNWMSGRNRKLRRGSINPLPWETLPVRARRIFQFMFKNRVFYDYEVQKILKGISSPSGSVVTWEEIINLDPEDKALFLTYITQERNCYKFDKFFLANRFLLKDETCSQTVKKGVCTHHNVEDLGVNLARNNESYFDPEFDFPGADGDIRHRKLRNVGFTISKGKPRSTKLVKRYARISDFRRKFLKGSMRSRRRKTLLWKTLQEKVRSAFFLRLIEVPILRQLPVEHLMNLKTKKLLTDSKKITDYQFGQQLTSSTSTKKDLSQSRLARSAVAARSDIVPIHNGRGYMLVFQSRFRKFIKLPILIVFKTLGRILLWQNSEWNNDWTKWKKEIHINCTFDGEEFSQDELPPRWSREGIQIKIVYPFQLKPWHSDSKKKQMTLTKKHLKIKSSGGQISKNKQKLRQKKPRFTYLTTLGYQTDIPFGKIQKQPSFWRPIRKELIKICKERFSLGTSQAYLFLDSNLKLEKLFKPSLIFLKKCNLFFKTRGVSVESLPTYNIQIKPLLDDTTEKIVGLNSDFDPINGKSSVEEQVQPANDIDKYLVNRKSTSQKFVTDNYTTILSNLSDSGVNIDQPNTKIAKTYELTLNYGFKDTDLTNFLRVYEEEMTGSKRGVAKFHIILGKTIEKYNFAISILYLKVSQKLRYYYSELVILCMQLGEVINTTTQKRDLAHFRSKNRLSQFDKTQWFSQADLYRNSWDLSVKKSLKLNGFLTGSENTLGKETRNNKYWDNNLNPYQIEQSSISSTKYLELLVDYRSTILSPNKISTCANNLPDNNRKTNKIVNNLFNEHVLDCIEEWGFLKRLCDLNINDWNKWLDCFSNHNLPLLLWRDVAPSKWNTSFNLLNELNKIEESFVNEENFYALRSKLHNYSIYTENPLLKDRIINLSKLRKRRHLLQSFIDFVRSGDIQKFSIRQEVLKRKFYFDNRISRILKVKRRKLNKLLHLCAPNLEIKFNSKFDLMPWLVTNFTRTRNPFKTKRRSSIDPILKDNTTYGIVLDITRRFQKVSDELYELMLDDREEMDYLFRWKWKSEAKLDNLRGLIAIVRMLGDDCDLVTLCANTNVDSDLLNLYFNATTKLDLFDDLAVLSAHRFSMLLDDQNLLYKIINPLLNFKLRLKTRAGRRMYKRVYEDIYISNLSLITKEVNKRESHVYNVEDLLLVRRRKEFRFLRSMLISRSPKLGARYFDVKFDSISKIDQIRNSEECEPSKLKSVQKIKRFMWPSHRLEELACTGRFCFNVTTGSQFAPLKLRNYPIFRH